MYSYRMEKNSKQKIKIIVLSIFLIMGISIYVYSSKQNKASIKGRQALAMEEVGLAEFNPENDTKENTYRSPQDTDIAKMMTPIFKEMSNKQDVEKNKQAIVSLGQIISKYPKFSDGYLLRATLYILIGEKDYPKIQSDIDNAIKYHAVGGQQSSFTSTANLHVLKAKVDILSGNYQPAINELETAINIDPSNTALLNTGGIMPEDESNSSAIQKNDVDLLVAKYPSDYRTYVFRGLFYFSFTPFNDKYYAKAIDNLSHALGINKNSALACYLLGEAYQREALWSKAAASDHTIWTGAGGGFRERTNAIALKYFAQAEQIDPKFPFAYLQIASQLFKLKKYAEAIPYYDKTIELQPDNAGAYNDRGLAKSNMGNYYDAITDLSKAIDLDKTHTDTSNFLEEGYENRAESYIKNRDYQNAIADYGRAIGIMFAQQSILMPLSQIRSLYPELHAISDQNLLNELRGKYFPKMKLGDFSRTILKNNQPFKEFVLGDLYTKRGDAYLLSLNFREAAQEYARAIFDGSVAIQDRWRIVLNSPDTEYLIDEQTMHFDSGKATLWVKALNKNTQVYSLQNYQIDCASQKIKSSSATSYDVNGNALFESKGQSWQLIVPDSVGEMLSKGACH